MAIIKIESDGYTEKIDGKLYNPTEASNPYPLANQASSYVNHIVVNGAKNWTCTLLSTPNKLILWQAQNPSWQTTKKMIEAVANA
jgi:hypothetical protein